jgi:UDP-glucuronate 4-epimerase
MTVAAPVLVTGAAGFIGSHVCHRLLADGLPVIGCDNLNDYYDPQLKRARLARLEGQPGFHHLILDICDASALTALFAQHRPATVIHLAAQAGIRYSLENPSAYAASNLVGFTNILEACRHHGCQHLVYASTSSVYGLDTAQPYRESQAADHPMTFYAATKRANELMAHSYAHLFGLPCTGLRFFTVYGPWGRPDMALFKFADAILAGQPIDLYDHGHIVRDFTYIDDIVDGLVRIAAQPATPDPHWHGDRPTLDRSSAPWRIYNIGNNTPVPLLRYVEALEQALGRPARRRLLPRPLSDAPSTHADTSALEIATGYQPRTSVRDGVARFVAWYQERRSP